MSKNYKSTNVYDEAKTRVSFIFDNFENIYLSFSGGKDSSVMLHVVAKEAMIRKRKFGLLFIDLEAQYRYTIDHVYELVEQYEDVIDLYWICLPLALRNAVSVYQPRWCCWDDDVKDVWVRDLPKNCIHDVKFFSFFRKNMEFEDFVVEFSKWYAQGDKVACFVGIRTDESLNRFRAIKNKKKEKFDGKSYTTKIYGTNTYNIYPIYDWRTRDIWIYNQRFKKKYNRLYDMMHRAGLTIHQQRICQPYGDDQRKGLWLFHVIEPDTWGKLISRVNGANSGSEFVKYPGNGSGTIKISKPENHTWKSFATLLINTMPGNMQEHYRNKIHVFLRWYEERGYRNGIPDEEELSLESSKKAPSWRRICKMLLRNDYWAKTIGFSQTKDGFFYKRYMKRVKIEREKRKKENYRKSGNWRGFV